MTAHAGRAPARHRSGGVPTVRLIVARSIPLPTDTVFAALFDLDCQSRWILATTVRPAGDRSDTGAAAGAPVPGPPAVGSRIEARTALAGIGFTDSMTVEGLDPPRRWRVRHTGGLVRGWGEWGVLPDCRGSRVYWAEEFEVPWGPVGRIGWVLVGGLVRAGIRASLARLDRGLRSGALVASSPPELGG